MEPRNLRKSGSSRKNKHGLTRYVPTKVATVVRRRCGFGCVICGRAIYTYEHFAPVFAQAKSHDPKGITLLCGDHQNQSTKGLLSKETIALADMNPCAKQRGYADHLFDLGGKRPSLVVGSSNFLTTSTLLINGRDYFRLDAPEYHSRLWRLTATFTDDLGKASCEIVNNELRIGADNFDFEQVGQRFLVHDYAGKEVLDMVLQPPTALVLHRFVIAVPVQGEVWAVRLESGAIEARGPQGAKLTMSNMVIDARVGITISPQGIALGST